MNLTRFLEKRRKTLLEWLREENLDQSTIEDVAVRVAGMGPGVDALSQSEKTLLGMVLETLKPEKAPVAVVEASTTVSVAGEPVATQTVVLNEEAPEEPKKTKKSSK